MRSIHSSVEGDAKGFFGLRTLTGAGRATVEHRRMIEAVAELTVATGLHATTVGEICERAGVSRRAFYYHFSDLREAFHEAYLDADHGLRQSVRDAELELATRIAGRLERSITGLVRFAVEHPVPAELWFVASLAAGPEVVEQRAATVAWLAAWIDGRDDDPLATALGGAADLSAEIAVGGVVGLIGDTIRRGAVGGLDDTAPALAVAASRVRGRASSRSSA